MYNHIIKKNDFPIKSFIYESVVELQILENYGRKKWTKRCDGTELISDVFRAHPKCTETAFMTL